LRSKQYGAVPFRIRDGRVEVLLITSRETKRWIVPKGWPQNSPRQTARSEAWEESGVQGKLLRKPLGSVKYQKRKRMFVSLKVFPLAVKKQHKKWPERKSRKARWFSIDSAAKQCDPALSHLMRKLKSRIS
jgi:8-oxo-dGTP pyrophosphatase MutT (NUDIX family)